ncbi:hypothetical protein [Nocardioides aquiterrae]|uniref:Sulfite exporter TauE/SafE family protein n=1 Tax=Nocardioides aquiterrae TaxID=203799 RepID=A0ABP4FFR4_9ACTN
MTPDLLLAFVAGLVIAVVTTFVTSVVGASTYVVLSVVAAGSIAPD